jgi:hypothetical protein
MKVFRLRWTDWEIEENYFFYGPGNISEEDFIFLTEDLKPQAIENAMKNSAHMVGWKHIVEEMSHLLQEKGFAIFEPCTSKFHGGMTIDEGDQDGLTADAYKKLIEFNAAANKKYEEEFLTEEISEETKE